MCVTIIKIKFSSGWRFFIVGFSAQMSRASNFKAKISLTCPNMLGNYLQTGFKLMEKHAPGWNFGQTLQ